MRPYPEITFELHSTDAALRLHRLISWLRSDYETARSELEKVPEEKVRTDTLGRQVVTENVRQRDAIKMRMARILEELATARVWLLECATPQSWRIGLELAIWINRPALAESRDADRV